MKRWTHHDSETLYNVPNWGLDFFRVNEDGNVEVRPEGDASPEAQARFDLYELIQRIRQRGVSAPILLRFDGILRARVRLQREAFDRAREEFGYEAPYRPVYPIKVNQERQVVEALLSESSGSDAASGIGLEVGSKPEMLAVMALQASDGSLMICNGYKDDEYVEMALLSSRLGVTPILVIEKLSDLDTILRASERLDIRPVLGVRTKLAGRGAGRWQDSVGDHSKFGLTTREIVQVAETLQGAGLLDCLQLLHFHIGSQITAIRSLKDALREGTQTLIGLHQLGAHIQWFDVGGGLGVDYDGSRTNFESSMNYSIQEYANDVMFLHWRPGLPAKPGLPQPTILSESGRAR